MSSPGTIRSNVLHMYRNLIKLAKNVTPRANSFKTLKMIRDEFRKPDKATLSNAEIENLLTKAQSNVSYLKMITPKLRDRPDAGEFVVSSNANSSPNNKSRVHSNWTGTNMDPDSVSRHNALLKRAGFVNNAHAKGGMF